jgi:hypothetical protein
MYELINTTLHRPNVTMRMVLRRVIIASLLMLAAPLATFAADDPGSIGATTTSVGSTIGPTDEEATPGPTTTALGPLHTDGTAKVAPAHPNHATPVSLAEKATDPSAVLMQMQFQYHDLDIDGDGPGSTKIIAQPVLPVSKKNVVRATMPFFSKPVASGQRERGAGDLVVLDFQLINTKHSTIGVGPAVSLPTATDDALGSGKLAIGPDILWIYKGMKKMQVGMLAEYLVSVAGDGGRADVNEFLWQPIYTRHWKWGYLSWSSQQMSVDFENDLISVPLGVVLGKVFMSSKKSPWNISFQPYYTVNNRGRSNEWAVEFQFVLIRPGFKW